MAINYGQTLAQLKRGIETMIFWFLMVDLVYWSNWSKFWKSDLIFTTVHKRKFTCKQ